MKYRILHRTHYTYQEPVRLCHNRLCLMPRSMAGQSRHSFDVQIDPLPEELTYRQDFFGNTLIFFSHYQEHRELSILAQSEVFRMSGLLPEQAVSSGFRWGEWRNLDSGDNLSDYDRVDFILPSKDVPLSESIREYTQPCFRSGDTLWNACHFLMQKIHQEIDFEPGFTTVNTPVEEVLLEKKGVCQDFAHLMIAALRCRGIPARYVSGYLETEPPPGQIKMTGADASHAWVGVYFPEVGWVEFDPTNNLLPSDRHITVAYGRDYRDVAPLKGVVFSSGEHVLKVNVDVKRIP